MPKMEALTILQPHAHRIWAGEKFVENRQWATHHRGWLAIHAGKSRKLLGSFDESFYPDMVFGKIVAVAWLSACIARDERAATIQKDPSLNWLHTHEWRELDARYWWVLSSVYRLREPLPYRGRIGLFTIPGRTVAQLQSLIISPGLRPHITAPVE